MITKTVNVLFVTAIIILIRCRKVSKTSKYIKPLINKNNKSKIFNIAKAVGFI